MLLHCPLQIRSLGALQNVGVGVVDVVVLVHFVDRVAEVGHEEVELLNWVVLLELYDELKDIVVLVNGGCVVVRLVVLV
jgi:hypothetical protein